MERKLIALCGIAGAGKDTLAKVLIDDGFTRVAFADGLKETCAELFPFMKKEYAPFEKEQPLNVKFDGKLITKTPREIWIETAEFIRKYNNNYFFNMAIEKIESSTNVVVTDLRTELEFRKMTELGFSVIYIEPKFKHYKPNKFDEQINDFMDEIPYTFVNKFNGTHEFIQFVHELNR